MKLTTVLNDSVGANKLVVKIDEAKPDAILSIESGGESLTIYLNEQDAALVASALMFWADSQRRRHQ